MIKECVLFLLEGEGKVGLFELCPTSFLNRKSQTLPGNPLGPCLQMNGLLPTNP